MKKEYKELETELVHFDYGTEVNTCEVVGCSAVECCDKAYGICQDDAICEDSIPICKCNNDIIHASGF